MTKKRAAGRIDEELVCFDSFVQRLREIDSSQEITFYRVPKSKHPPDFRVTIAGVKYAVEVTSIVTGADYDDWCKKLLETIRSESETNNTMKGTYALTIVGRPDIPRRGTTHWRKLVSTAATKIREMSDAPCGAESCLLRDANGYAVMVIQKTSAQGSTIRRMPAMKWEGEVQEELSRLIKERIEAKRKGLERKRILDQCPNVILLLHDAYLYCQVDDVKRAFLNVQGYEWLHSIFIAMSFSDRPNILYPNTPGRRGMFLYSKNKQWR